ncbi:MAG TPA: M28 family peptidase [Jiangellaceae bacterium]|nr:M28 family peptidase [Jiangellaceae bacterium]
MRPRQVAPTLLVLAWAVACSSGSAGPTPTAPGESPLPRTPSSTATLSTPTPTPTPTPAVFDPAAAFATVERLATGIGPREASSAAFEAAAAEVELRFAGLGYRVTRMPVPVPAGNSWGVDVPAGTSTNVVADPPGFDPAAPHVVVGAHLDTVPQAPGAEDNASGVAVVLELARLAMLEPPPVAVRFIAFGAEEPRGDGDALHHFGSQQYVRELTPTQRAATAAMVSLDRVGVPADHVPVCTGGRGTVEIRDALVAAAGTVDVPVETCENRASDHWSFEKADIPSARLGSIPYAGYHSADDVPSVVDPAQLDRVGRIVWAWLSSR